MNDDLYNEFIAGLKCNVCESSFDENSVSIVRQENSCTVIKITCPKCGKNIGLAIMGINNPLNQGLNHLSSQITQEEVEKARDFIYGLGNDWAKYLPQND